MCSSSDRWLNPESVEFVQSKGRNNVVDTVHECFDNFSEPPINKNRYLFLCSC